jgi:hypothetical protein
MGCGFVTLELGARKSATLVASTQFSGIQI